MTKLHDRPVLYRQPHFDGQFTVYPSPHQPSSTSGVYLVDKAVQRDNRSLEWVAQDLDASSQAKAALQGYLAAQAHITAHNRFDGGPRFAAGAFTNQQFKHFVANLTAHNSHTHRGFPRPGISSSLEQMAQQAITTVLDIARRPLPNAIHGMIALGVFAPKASSQTDLDRQTEIQHLIQMSSPAGNVPGVLADAQNTAQRDDLYGLYIGEWLATTKPDLVQDLSSLSPPITRYLSGTLATLQQIHPGPALSQDFIGFPKGTAISSVQDHLDTLGRAYTANSWKNPAQLTDGVSDNDRFTVSVLRQSTSADSAFDSQPQTLMSSNQLDRYQLEALIDGALISFGELIEYDGQPVGSFTSGNILSDDQQSQSQTWLLLEAVNGNSVSPEIVDGFADAFGLNVLSQPQMKHHTTMKMG
ncbi:hypothetical protein [Pseudomonas syringae]|uniref:hypothetical protein n=1 Tax=Pseudomonas syringae TaxID=317 RepID=UPI002462EEB0|nr:hypothetical protein [Pseudomonas syringae]MDH4602494.1 hypothetical protein [Pseudomonas syringae pv. papulans]